MPGTVAPLISVVVPSHQRERLLRELLLALADETMPHDQFEVIVVADGSTDGTREMLAAFAPPYAFQWRWQPRAGRASACNRGIALARGELIVLLDDDMKPAPGFLAAHAAEHPPGSRRAVMGAAPIPVRSGAPPVARYVARKFNTHLDKLAVPGRRLSLRAFYSGNLSIPRAVLAEVGGFDEDFTAYGHEDLELCLKLRAAGVEIAFSPAAVAYQEYDKDFPALARDNVEKGRTAVLLASKHPAAYGEMKLAAMRNSSLPRRLALATLVQLTRAWQGTYNLMVRLLTAADRHGLPGTEHAYAFVLDYCFLLGARAMRREMGSRAPLES